MALNVIVGQSGGPTCVINSSLAGVFKASKNLGVKKVYGMLHGIKGLLNDEYVDLDEKLKSNIDIDLLKRTPASFLGSCRFKLPEIGQDEEIYKKIFEKLESLSIGYFFYIGGNDSMDTIKKLSDYAAKIGSKICFVGVPKTIDNDLAMTDHTPGFGSAAKYIATTLKELVCDCRIYDCEAVTIVEIMGRNAGWLTGASALSAGEDCDGPDLIYVPEVPFDVASFTEKIRKLLEEKDVVVACVSEGIRTKEGKYICEFTSGSDSKDAFGHIQMTGTAAYLAEVIHQELGCKTRAVEFSTLQRSAAHLASKVDVDEAFMVGGATVKAADEGSTGVMVVIDRVSDDPYQSATGVYDVHRIANDEKVIPRKWINKEGDYVTEEFINYARPLIQGHYNPTMVDGLPRHLSMNVRNYEWLNRKK